MAAKLPTTQPANADFFGLLVGVPNTTTPLNGAHDSAVTTITVDAVPTGAPSAGAVFIDNECITYTGKTATTLTGCTRGAQDTTAASHTDDATVRWGLTKGTVNQLIEELVQMSKTGAGAKGADVASAAALNIGEDGHYFHVTGTTTITSIETRLAGQVVILVFDGALTLTHNATSLILQGGTNLTTAAGDVVAFVNEGSGNWRELFRRLASAAGGQRSITLVNSALTTTSTSYVDLTGATKTITTTGGDVEIRFEMVAYPSSANEAVLVQLVKDGTAVGTPPQAINYDVSGGQSRSLGLSWLDVAPTAASHTYKIQWKSSIGTSTASNGGYEMRLIVIEHPH